MQDKKKDEQYVIENFLNVSIMPFIWKCRIHQCDFTCLLYLFSKTKQKHLI